MSFKTIFSKLKPSRKYLKWIFFLGVFVFLCVYFSNRSIENNAKGKTFSDAKQIPHNSVGVLLGTSKYLRNGTLNPYFLNRVQAAVELFNAGKIDYILVSGDNSTKEYDEVTDFKNALIERGIPAERIYLDYAGFRTLDTVVRAKEIFGQTKISFISQKFHNERAIFLAEAKGISAVGFNAEDVSLHFGIKVSIREYLARVKVFWDLLFAVQPKFLGEKVFIGK